MKNRTVILIILITILIAFSIFTIAQANSGNLFVIPSAKQTVEAQQTASQATIIAKPHVTKPSKPASVPEQDSCPAPTPDRLGIRSLLNTPIINFPFSGGGNLVSEASATASTGNYYWMWSGAPDDERGEPTAYPKKGLIRVIVFFADPCVSHKLGTQEPPMTDYFAPKGPLTFTKIDGDTVSYSIAGGGNGHFNFVTGTFLP